MDKLHILILEDVDTDAELVERELRKGEWEFTPKRVATRDAYLQELEAFAPDLILADYSLPGFNGAEALTIAKEQCPVVPFVFVSGAIGEDMAIEMLKQGATDYVLKNRLSRLLPSVRRALSEAEERSARLRAEESLRQSEEKHRALLEINNAIVANLVRESLLDAIAQAVAKLVPFDLMRLGLLDTERDVLQIQGLAGDESVRRVLPLGAEFPRREGHLAWVFDEKRPRVCRDLESEQRNDTEDELLKAGIRSYIVVPLMAKGEPFAALMFASRSSNAYSSTEATFLLEVGHQVALALENMLAYETIDQLKAQLEQDNRYLREEIESEYNFHQIIGNSAALKDKLHQIEQVAPTDATVLICGETGTGKELFARAIHDLSPRNDRPLVKVNCAAISAGLVESELFGHEKGSFTGAVKQHIGRFELADGGTLFLDEVGELPMDTQVKLLRVLQEQEFERVGSSRPIQVDVRLIAATNRVLSDVVEAGDFRADLFYRLNVFPIEVPPLRERRSDIPLLIDHVINKLARKLGKPLRGLSSAAMDRLMGYAWPGNIRELENVIERATIVAPGPLIEVDDLLLAAVIPLSTGSEPHRLEDVERAHILSTLDKTNWVIAGEQGAAVELGINPNTLRSRIAKLGIKRSASAE